MSYSFPFSAIVGQDEMKHAILVAAVDPGVGGVLVFGDRGTGKSTAVRALAALLPKMRAIANCPYGCDPEPGTPSCEQCAPLKADGHPKTVMKPVPVVDMPLGATEVNLLEDHLVDLLIDVAASGENMVEREGLSVRHPARFVLVGSGNPEEGELRPQLLDRFGLAVDVTTPTDLKMRIEVVRRRDAYERAPETFIESWRKEDEKIRKRIVAARKKLPDVDVPDHALTRAAQLCMALGTDGLRGELALMRASRALAAFEGHDVVNDSHLKRMAAPALRHRLRRNPLDDAGSGTRVARAVDEIFV